MKSKASFLWILFFVTLLVLTVSSAQAQVPSKARVAIHVVNRFWSLDDATVLLSSSNGTPVATQKTMNGTADFLLPTGVYKAKILKTIFGIEQAIGNQTFEVIDTTRSYQVNVTEELYSLHFTVLDSSLTLDSLINVTDSDGHRFLDNSTVRLEFCLAARDKASGEKYYWHSLGLLHTIPFKQISLQKCWFPEYGVKRPPHIENSSTYGYWMHRETIQGIFYVPYLVPRGSYLVKVWDGSHLIGKFNLNVTNDAHYALYVPYDGTEQANYVRAQVNELDQQNATLSVKVVTPELEPVANANVTVKSAGNTYSEITTIEGWANFTLPIYQTYTVHVSGAFKAPEPCSVWLDGDKELIIDPVGSGASLTIQNGRFYDAYGNRLFLSGVNYITTDTNRWKDWNPSLESQQLDSVRNAGFNSIRLYLRWDYLEPSRGVFSQTYFDRLAWMIEEADKRGIYVTLYACGMWGGWVYAEYEPNIWQAEMRIVEWEYFTKLAQFIKTKGYKNIILDLSQCGTGTQAVSPELLTMIQNRQNAVKAVDSTIPTTYVTDHPYASEYYNPVDYATYVDILGFNDFYQWEYGETTISTEVNMLAKFNKPIMIFESGMTWFNPTLASKFGAPSVDADKKFFQDRLTAASKYQLGGYTIYCWRDAKLGYGFGLTDVNYQPKVDLIDFIKELNSQLMTKLINLVIRTVDSRDSSLCGAEVIIKGSTEKDYVTNEFGYITLNLQSGFYKISVYWMGVNVNTADYSLTSDSTVTIKCEVYDLTVQLVRPDGTPIVGKMINLYRTDGLFITSATTDSAGYCTFKQLPIQFASYFVICDLFQSSRIPLTTNTNITLVLGNAPSESQKGGGGIDGRGSGEGSEEGGKSISNVSNFTFTVSVISKDGTPVPKANVEIIDASGDAITSGLTNENGIASFSVATGNYTIIVHKGEYTNKTTVCVAQDDFITVTLHKSPTSNLTLLSIENFLALALVTALLILGCNLIKKFRKNKSQGA